MSEMMSYHRGFTLPDYLPCYFQKLSIVKLYKFHHCCSCKNYCGKGMEGRKEVSLHRFLADQKITILLKKCVLGHPIAQATSYCLILITF